jgi:hypothetical protein
MHHPALIAAASLASSTHSTHVGPWIIVPILILIALIGTPIYIVRDRRRRRTSR